MKLTVSWPRPDHPLLKHVDVVVDENGVPGIPLLIDQVMRAGQNHAEASITIGAGEVASQKTRLRIVFKSDLVPGQPVLDIEQTILHRGTRDELHYSVRTPDGITLDVRGLHPLLDSTTNLDRWHVKVDTRLVDVTAAVGTEVATALDPVTQVPTAVRDLVNTGNQSSVRVLARTDGLLPAFWLTCIPKLCRGAQASDVLCFFAAPQGSPAPDIKGQLAEAVQARASQKQSYLSGRRAVYLGQGFDVAGFVTYKDADDPPVLLDHFATRLANSKAVGLNVIIARGWEQALVDSKRHVALVVPIAASGSHNSAAGGDLPRLLGQVHGVLQSTGDVTPPAGGSLDRPRYGLAGHSLGAAAAFAALRARPKAFSDVFLFEPMKIRENLDALARTPASICLVGFDHGDAVGPFHTLSGSPQMRARLRLLPKGYQSERPDKAKLSEVEARSPNPDPERNPRSLAHALSTIPSWTPDQLVPGERYTFRYAMLHNYIVAGGDNEGVSGGAETHFLTQALKDSTFR